MFQRGILKVRTKDGLVMRVELDEKTQLMLYKQKDFIKGAYDCGINYVGAEDDTPEYEKTTSHYKESCIVDYFEIRQ